jgi:hypothetical protein
LWTGESGSGAVSGRSLFFVELCGNFFAAFAVKSFKALNRKARKGIAKDTKKINCTIYREWLPVEVARNRR